MRIFWAWQYDLPGKTSRHLIKSALEDAVTQINEVNDITEPDESFQNGSMELDYGRKGLKGSPDLAIEILKKIDAATVFIGDVTPVGIGEPHNTDEGVASHGRLLMNPNVAVELGYALKALSTENVLMVMNSHYGKRSDMPFDLGHKGGPILYDLAPDASKAQIEAEKKKLTAVLVDALREYVPRPTIQPFTEMTPKIGQGIYFEDGEVLGANQNDRDKTKYYMPFRSVMWLRLIPSRPLGMPLPVRTLLDNIRRFGPFGMPVGMEPIRENAYGVAFFGPAGQTSYIDNISQYTRDGEIWGINADILRQGKRGVRSFLYTLSMENLFITQLALYLEFMQQISEVPIPVVVEAGIEGIKDVRIAHHGYTLDGGKGAGDVMHLDQVKHRSVLRSFGKSHQEMFLLEFFRKVNANTGVPRPAGLYGRG